MARSILLILASVLAVSRADEVDDFVKGSLSFTMNLYREEMITNSSGVLLSPISMQTLLAFTQSGAVGATGEEIRSGFFLPGTTEATETAINRILTSMDATFANRIYGETNFTTGQHFKEVANEIYQADVRYSDFTDSKAIRSTINDWVGEQTNGSLGTIFCRPTDFTDVTREFLINTFFMSKSWTYKFPSSETKKQKYSYGTGADEYTDAYTMTQSPNYFNYYDDSEARIEYLELPLDDDNTTLTIVLPYDIDGVDVLQESSLETLFITPDYTKEYIQVSLPRMSIKIAYQELTGGAQKLGLQSAFSDTNADFSLIGGAPSAIRMHDVKHSTYIRIDENTVEASAAGFVNLGVSGTKHLAVPTDSNLNVPLSKHPAGTTVFEDEPDAKHFNVNHPFVLYIKIDGVVAFVGRVEWPTAIIIN